MKRMMMTAATIIVSLAAHAQIDYSVTGTASEEVKMVYLMDMVNRAAVIDSATVTNGKFQLKGSQPSNALLGVGDRGSALLFINDGTPITASLADFTLKGSALNEKLNGYNRELMPIDADMTRIVALARAGAISREKMDSVGRVYVSLAEKKEQRILEIINENVDNMIPVAFLEDMARSLDYEQLKNLCQPSRPYYNHPAMARPRQLMQSLEKRAIGRMFTDMTIKDMNGVDRKLSDWIGKGQYVMIDFWASWCGPCRQEMPNVVANYAKYHSKGFEIIGISFDRSAEPWKKAVEQMGMKWPQLSDLGYWQSAAAGVYGINAIPASILFDGEGKIIATDLRGEQLGEKLRQLYGF